MWRSGKRARMARACRSPAGPNQGHRTAQAGHFGHYVVGDCFASQRVRQKGSPISCGWSGRQGGRRVRSEEHTSELQSRLHLVCRLLLEKKKKKYKSASKVFCITSS